MAGSLVDAERFITAVQELGGTVPVALTNILVTKDMLDAQSVSGADPAMGIIKAGIAGNLSEKKLSALLAEAATAQMIRDYAGSLRASRLEPMLAREFHSALRAGSANDVIGSLRQQWDTAVEFIARAHAVISPESTVEHFLASTTDPDSIALWQGLDERLNVVRKISLIVAEFGPRSRTWPMFRESGVGDMHLVENVAVFCTAGYLPQDSAVLRIPDPHGHKSSPYYRLQLRLHTVESAQDRYRGWCASEWDRLNADRPRSGRVMEGGEVVYDEPRVNPFSERTSA